MLLLHNFLRFVRLSVRIRLEAFVSPYPSYPPVSARPPVRIRPRQRQTMLGTDGVEASCRKDWVVTGIFSSKRRAIRHWSLQPCYKPVIK